MKSFKTTVGGHGSAAVAAGQGVDLLGEYERKLGLGQGIEPIKTAAAAAVAVEPWAATGVRSAAAHGVLSEYMDEQRAAAKSRLTRVSSGVLLGRQN